MTDNNSRATAAAERPATESYEPTEREAKVTIRIPKGYGNGEDTVFVGVNGRTWRIKKGVSVEVPACAAEVLKNSEAAEDYAVAYEERL